MADSQLAHRVVRTIRNEVTQNLAKASGIRHDVANAQPLKAFTEVQAQLDVFGLRFAREDREDLSCLGQYVCLDVTDLEHICTLTFRGQ